MRGFPASIRHRDPRGQRGVTLVELMVVVVIIGAVVSAAAISMTPEPEVKDEAQKIAAYINEAARLAISGGTVNPNVTQGTGITARGRLRIIQNSGGFFLVVERFRESDVSWVERKRVYLGEGVQVGGWTPIGALDPGTSPMLVPPFSPSNPAPFTQCDPDGTCTPMTLYLQDAERPDQRARVVVLALNGMMTQVFDRW